jgi:hypothetical protein
MAIPPSATRTALIAYSDDSNGPPGIFNSPVSPKPLLIGGGQKIRIEVTASNSATWSGEFYIECHGNYLHAKTEDLPQYTEPSTIEFIGWDEWQSDKVVTQMSLYEKRDCQPEEALEAHPETRKTWC